MEFTEVANIIVNVIIVILCTFGNSLVIISLRKFAWLRVPTNYFVAFLAFYDFCNGLPASSFFAVTSFLSTQNDNITIQYDISCKINVYIAAFSGYGNLLSVILITVDRYIYINWPLRYSELVTNRKALMVSAICFIFTNLMAVMGLYDQDAVKPCNTIQMFRYDVVIFLVVPTFLLAVILVIILYGQIGWLTYKARKSIANQITSNNQSESQKKTTKVISLVVGVFMATYLMYFTGFFVALKVNNIWIQTIVIWLWQVCRYLFVCRYFYLIIT